MSIPKALRGIKHLEAVYYLTQQRPTVLPPYTGVLEALRKFTFLTGYWRKYGLYHDDILYEYPHVKEAIRRLPLEVQDARNHRIIRAIQCDIKHDYLPEDEWTTYEVDRTLGRYLEPYINDVLKELKEQDKWDADH